MLLRSARRIFAVSCAMAGALTALGPANLAAAAPAATAPCASPLRQAISLAISHQIPDPAGPSAPCKISPPPASPAAKPRATSATESVTDLLAAVDAVSATDMWAVGIGGTPSAHTTLTEHWNGSSWALVPSPSPGTSDSLLSVSAESATDAGAVGEDQGTGGFGPLTEHWDGSAWSVVPSPNPGSGSVLQSVSARSATDVWAAGFTESGTGLATNRPAHPA